VTNIKPIIEEYMEKSGSTSARAFSKWLRQYPGGPSHATVASWIRGEVEPRYNDLFVYHSSTPANSPQRVFAKRVLEVVNPQVAAAIRGD
jgi:hypothetical protein